MAWARGGGSWFHGTVGPGRYLAVGLALSAVKMEVDYWVAGAGFGRTWTPLDYAFPGRAGGPFGLDGPDRLFYLTMLAVSLPFQAVGLVLTVRRLRDAGWPLWLAALFFAPAPVNLLFFLVLGVMPGQRFGPMVDAGDVPGVSKKDPTAVPSWVRALVAVVIPFPVAAAALFLGTSVFREYGWSVFVGLPFVMPMASVVIYGYRAPKTRRQCLNLGLAWVPVAFLSMLAFGFEGAICLLMALPLMLPVVMMGVMVGYFIVNQLPGHRDGLGKVVGVLLAALPAMVGAEHASAPASAPPPFAVTTTMEVDAPPDRVWRHVVSFPDLPAPTDLMFRAGIAYPVRARIDGEGAGAVRRCEFSTGSFVEPIEVWDEPRLLRFGVTSNPPPMREWNPFFEIHPPHLEGFLVSRRGEFRLTALPGGRTLLAGTTWYHHGLWPSGYWRAWSDPILHRIHARVLGHVKALAERGGRSF